MEDDSESFEESDSESGATLIIKRAGNEECVGKYVEEGTKDDCPKFVKKWTVSDEPDKLYCIEIFRQFSNETQKRYWWIMGRVFNAETKTRISTSLLYCTKSGDNFPPSSGWKILRDGKKPPPKLKEIKSSPKNPTKKPSRKQQSAASVSSESEQSFVNTHSNSVHDIRHYPYMMANSSQRTGQIRQFAMDKFLASAQAPKTVAKTHRSEPAGGARGGAEENLMLEASDNLLLLLSENRDNVMMILNNIRDLKTRHSKSTKYMKTIDKKNPNRRQITKSMDEEKRMIGALIEMNTTLTRNCSYLCEVAQAMQYHLRDTYRAKTHDAALSEKNLSQSRVNSLHSQPTLTSQPSQTQNPQMMQQQQAMQMQQQQQQQAPPQMMQQQFIPQQMPQQAISSAPMTQVSHRSQPTLVSLQRPPQTQLLPQQVQQVPMQMTMVQQQRVQQQRHLRQMTAVHRPTNTTTAYVQQARVGQAQMRPATITTAQHRITHTAGVPMNLMQNPTIIPSQVMYRTY